MILRFVKLNDRAVTPTYGSEYSAGADLYSADDDLVIEPGKTAMIHTGIAVEIPEGFVGLVYARSGLAVKKGIAPANKVGVIDSDYRGEIMVALYNHGEIAQEIKTHDRVAQMVITPFIHADYIAVDELSDTKRGEGGFGSTGK